MTVLYGERAILLDPYVTTNVNELGDPIEFPGWHSATLAPNGKIYCLPYLARTVLVIDPATGTTYQFGNVPPRRTFGETPSGPRPLWSSAALLGTNIYCAPAAAESIGVIDTTTDTITTLGSFPDLAGGGGPGAVFAGTKFSGIWASGGLLFMAGFSWTATFTSGSGPHPGGMVVVDPTDGSYTQHDWPTIDGFATRRKLRVDVSGALHPNGRIYAHTNSNGDPRWNPPGPGLNRIVTFDTDTRTTELATLTVGGFTSPRWSPNDPVAQMRGLTGPDGAVWTGSSYIPPGALPGDAVSIFHDFEHWRPPATIVAQTIYQLLQGEIPDFPSPGDLTGFWEIRTRDMGTGVEDVRFPQKPPFIGQEAATWSSAAVSADLRFVFAVPWTGTMVPAGGGAWVSDPATHPVLRIGTPPPSAGGAVSLGMHS